MQPNDPLGTTFAALADPTRRAILARLAAGEASVKELSAPFEMSQPAISKHLRVLERAGLIEQGRQAQWRPRRLRAQPLRDVADWIDQYRRHWDQSFERLDAYLHEIQDDDADPRRRARHEHDHRALTRTPPPVYSDGTSLVYERIFDAPRDVVWAGIHGPRSHPALVGSARHDDDRRRDGRPRRWHVALQ